MGLMFEVRVDEVVRNSITLAINTRKTSLVIQRLPIILIVYAPYEL